MCVTHPCICTGVRLQEIDSITVSFAGATTPANPAPHPWHAVSIRVTAHEAEGGPPEGPTGKPLTSVLFKCTVRVVSVWVWVIETDQMCLRSCNLSM